MVDPAASNIIDMFIITRGYYTALIQWLVGTTALVPTLPTPLDLRNSYAELLENKMLSDTLVLQSGTFKLLFGAKAEPAVRAIFSIIRPIHTSLTDNEVKARIVEIVRNFFDINTWEYGETFFWSELSASIHAELGPEIDSIVLVPTYAQNQFGDLFQIPSRENEMFLADINTVDMEIVQSYTPENIRQ